MLCLALSNYSPSLCAPSLIILIKSHIFYLFIIFNASNDQYPFSMPKLIALTINYPNLIS